MNPAFSLYLDAVRVVAALLVIVYHSNLRLLTTDKLPLSGHGHGAVIVFFVLSGYVIAWITATRETTPHAYWTSRLARFYSVALPVVLVTPLLDVAGASLAPQFYAGATTHDLAAVRIVASLAFLNEWWALSIMSFSNVPYWSLCYEFWYYALYAAWCFGGARRRWLVGSGLLLVGPKIVLLAPVWLLGVVLYRWQRWYRVGPVAGALLVAASWLAYAVFHQAGMSQRGSDWLHLLLGADLHRELAFSRFFITDYLLALIVGVNFIGMRAWLAAPMPSVLVLMLAPAALIRTLAGYTFTAYVLHQPLLQLFAAVIDGDPRRPWFYLATMGATLATIAVAGLLTEHQRHHWRRWCGAGLTWVRRRLPAWPAAKGAHG
jgi:peptidoglycan/LPS O-acetylase OafA/YrhL